jgi:hypothetical protein
VPAVMKMKAVTMRSTLSSCGDQLDHFEAMFDALMGFSSRSFGLTHSTNGVRRNRQPSGAI